MVTDEQKAILDMGSIIQDLELRIETQSASIKDLITENVSLRSQVLSFVRPIGGLPPVEWIKKVRDLGAIKVLTETVEIEFLQMQTPQPREFDRTTIQIETDEPPDTPSERAIDEQVEARAAYERDLYGTT